MVSFEIDGDGAAANRMVEAAPQLPFAPTLGDVGTTLSHPASSSHRALTPEARAALGISDGFFRVSVGIEEIDLLTSDFDMGLAASEPSGAAQPGRHEPVAGEAEAIAGRHEDDLAAVIGRALAAASQVEHHRVHSGDRECVGERAGVFDPVERVALHANRAAIHAERDAVPVP
jgi:hypothetical protein